MGTSKETLYILCLALVLTVLRISIIIYNILSELMINSIIIIIIINTIIIQLRSYLNKKVAAPRLENRD